MYRFGFGCGNQLFGTTPQILGNSIASTVYLSLQVVEVVVHQSAL